MGGPTPANDPQDLVLKMFTPISINGLKKAVRQLKEAHGSNIRVLPVPGGIEFRAGGVPNKGQNPHKRKR